MSSHHEQTFNLKQYKIRLKPHILKFWNFMCVSEITKIGLNWIRIPKNVLDLFSFYESWVSILDFFFLIIIFK